MSVATALTTSLADEHWHGPGAWWPLIPLTWLLVVGTVVTLFLMAGRRRARTSGQRAGERRLAERYAAGEIDENEYARRLGVLRSTGAGR